MKEGMEFRIFRGSNPGSKNQWVGKATAVKVEARQATLNVTEGEARITDLVISQPVQLTKETVMPKADRTDRPKPPVLTVDSVEVKLYANAENMGKETVCFGLPFPPNAIKDDSTIAVFQGGAELPVATKILAPWRIDAKDGSPRSILIQFPLDFTGKAEQTVTVRWDKPRTKKLDTITPVKDLLVQKSVNAKSHWERQKEAVDVKLPYEEPRVLAVLPAKWLCDSWVAGPEIPVVDNNIFPSFDKFWTDKFPSRPPARSATIMRTSNSIARTFITRCTPAPGIRTRRWSRIASPPIIATAFTQPIRPSADEAPCPSNTRWRAPTATAGSILSTRMPKA